MSDKIAAKGTLFRRGDGATPTEVFATIGGATNITPPQRTAEQIEVTSHDSGSYREYIPSFKDEGEASVEFFYDDDDTQHQGLLADFEADVKRNFKIVFPDSSIWSFSGYVVGFEISSPFDGALTATARIKVTGSVTRS